MKEVIIHTEYIKLEQLLKLADLCGSGGEAKNRILDGEAAVNGVVCTERGHKCRPGDMVAFAGEEIKVESER